ncbi:hypothetical protein EAH87_10660 [Sphingomonas koreensis]|nr:hypothetical protein EAH87_10660 [Sphingomonas koreensis]
MPVQIVSRDPWASLTGIHPAGTANRTNNASASTASITARGVSRIERNIGNTGRLWREWRADAMRGIMGNGLNRGRVPTTKRDDNVLIDAKAGNKKARP